MEAAVAVLLDHSKGKRVDVVFTFAGCDRGNNGVDKSADSGDGKGQKSHSYDEYQGNGYCLNNKNRELEVESLFAGKIDFFVIIFLD